MNIIKIGLALLKIAPPGKDLLLRTGLGSVGNSTESDKRRHKTQMSKVYKSLQKFT